MQRMTIFVLALAGLAAAGVQACECGPPDTFEATYAGSAAVFIGTAVSIEHVNSQFDRITFDVGPSWKGPFGPTIVVETSATAASCGYFFVLGRTYLAYAGPASHVAPYGIFACGRTHFSSPTDPDLALLGPARTNAVQPTAWSLAKVLFR